MKKINFIFGVHNHQPVGNFDNVFEWATKSAYEPFLDVIEKHPDIKIVFHYTGCLIDWFEKNRPEILNRLKILVEKGQAEILTGGYYEPILSSIPDADKSGQIKKLSDYIKEKFLHTPRGMWLAERVWEPSLAKTLNEAGVEYIVLDDSHFLAGGIEEKKLRGYFITEEQGATLKIFPISQYLRYAMPFADPAESIKYLKSEASDDPSQLLIMADDGEKFGVWPDTYKTCYEEKWLEKFLTLLEENSDWLNTTTFSEYVKKFPAKDRIYIPAASYFEMSEWTLSAKSQVEFEEIVAHADSNLKRFLKGGFWRNFLTKYSESNQMHKKMLHVSGKINNVASESREQRDGRRSAQKSKDIALPLQFLYKGQCNCAYWHGIFGGLYLPHLRHAIYKNLIEAEIKSEAGSRKPEIEIFDFDKDGQDEIIFTNKIFNIYTKPSHGGAITEIDFRPACYNLTDVLTRRFEAYHKKVDIAVIKSDVAQKKLETIHGVYYTKELELQKYLKYDWYNRYSLIDHFFHPTTTLEKFSDCEYGELGDFVNQPYKSEVTSRQSKVVLRRDGHLWTENGALPVQVVKSISSSKSDIIVGYKITNNSSIEKEIWFGSEFNFAMSSPDDENCFYKMEKRCEKFNTKTCFEKTSLLKISDKNLNINLNLMSSDLFDFWVFPIWAISLSEGGFEKTYQGSSVTPNKKFFLKPKETFSFEIKISVCKI
ncbi:MAG: alpha-amylase/4-alpha-glucanotransferase domain-containing protein [Elusimicrobiota bacterium]